MPKFILATRRSRVNMPLRGVFASHLGFELREAANGQEAIDIWETWQPHLIWMDMRMPVLDGYETTKRIRALGTGHSVLGTNFSAPSTQHPAPSTQ